MTELQGGLQETISGHGRLFLIAGEPGIGKTRLAEELAAYASWHGMKVLWGRCWDGGGAPANWPWIQILRSLVRAAAPDDPELHMGERAAYIAQLVPELRERVPGLPEGPTESLSPDPDRARFHLFDSVTTFLRNAAAACPLVLMLDDLHAADLPSLLLLQFLTRELREARVLVLSTYRDSEARMAPAVMSAIGDLAREGQPVRLHGLNAPEVGQLITAMTGETARDAIVGTVHRITEGNPFFVDAIVRLLVAEGGVPADIVERLGIPDEVRESIRRRLRPLSKDAPGLLTIAAVIGREFELPVLEAASGMPHERALGVLEEASAAALVTATSAPLGRFQFTHAHIRETLYEDLPLSRRVELHRQVGLALETFSAADPDARAAELAHHFFEALPAGDMDRAIDYAMRAGKRAMATFASEEAVKEYERAHLALEQTPPSDERRLRVLIELAEALYRTGQDRQAHETATRAVDVAEKRGARVELARATLMACPGLWTGAFDPANVRLLERALAALGPEDSIMRARLLVRLGYEFYFTEETRRRSSHFQDAAEVARRVGDPSTLSTVLFTSTISLVGTASSLDERLAMANEALDLARAVSKDLEANTWRLKIAVLLERGDVTAFDVELEALVRLAEQQRYPYVIWVATLFRAGRLLMEGRFSDAERVAGEAFAVSQRFAGPDPPAAFGGQMFQLRREQGRLDELEAAVKSHVEQFPGIPAWRVGLALLYAELGREADTRIEFERIAANDFADLSENYMLPTSLAHLSTICAFLGDTGRAEKLHERLIPYAGRNLLMGQAIASFGAADHFLGILAAVMSHWEDAERHFEAALATNARMGARPLLARTRAEYARMLLARNGSSDRKRALSLLDEALDTARELGMKTLAERADALKKSAQSVTVAERLPGNLFHKEGDYWTIVYSGTVIRLKDSKGFAYLALLLRSPGREFHAAELVSLEAGASVPSKGGTAELEVSGLGDAGEIIDARAKEEYRRRVSDLRGELEEARRFNDPERARRAEEELESLTEALAAGLGLGGRDRRAKSHAERARLNVTRALHRTLQQIAEKNRALSRHLEKTVRTGIFCSYDPDPRAPIDWQG